MTTQRKRDHLIGIDPSFTNLGVCWKNPVMCKNSEAHRTWTFSEFQRYIRSEGTADRLAAIIENPDLDSHAWTSWEEFRKVLQTNGLSTQTERAFKKALKIAGDVGKNKAAAQQIIVILNELNIPFVEIAPSTRDRASKGMTRGQLLSLSSPTKTTRKQYKEITGEEPDYQTEHSRDAGTLLVGRSVAWVLAQNRLRSETSKANGRK